MLEADEVAIVVPVEIFSCCDDAAKDELKDKSTSVTLKVKVSEFVVVPSETVTVNECEVLVS